MAFQTALLPVSLDAVASSHCASICNASHRLTCSNTFQDLVAASAEAWPSVANTVMGSWRATSTRREARPTQIETQPPEALTTVSLTIFHSPAQFLLMLISTSSTPGQTALISYATTMPASYPPSRLLRMGWHRPIFNRPLPTCRPSLWLPQPTLLFKNPLSVLLPSRLSVLCGACSRHLRQQCNVLLAS